MLFPALVRANAERNFQMAEARGLLVCCVGARSLGGRKGPTRGPPFLGICLLPPCSEPQSRGRKPGERPGCRCRGGCANRLSHPQALGTRASTTKSNALPETPEADDGVPFSPSTLPPFLKFISAVALIVSHGQTAYLFSRGARQERCSLRAEGAIPAVPKWQLPRGGLAASEQNLWMLTRSTRRDCLKHGRSFLARNASGIR